MSTSSTILLVHNHYQQRGGEDRVFEMERQLLEAHGHHVLTYTLHNDAIFAIPSWRVALEALWNHRAARELATLVREQKVQIVHFHNTFPRVSPAAYHAVRRAGAVVVQTLHNYRLLCAGALLYRNGKPCEECLGRCFPLPALRHRCYRNSLFATATVVLMQMLHRLLGTWQKEVDVFVALTEGAKARFAPALLPPEKVHVVGNFLPDGPMPSAMPPKGHALFIGRLDPSKGVRTLLDAWASSPKGLPDLVIAGEGPLAREVQSAASLDPRIRWVGFCEPDQIRKLLDESSLVLVPSEWPEMFGVVLLEAWSAGRPVLASRIGALEELITPDLDGWLAPPQRPEAWAHRIIALHASPGECEKAGAMGSQSFEQHYSALNHYAGLNRVYASAVRNGSRHSGNAKGIREHLGDEFGFRFLLGHVGPLGKLDSPASETVPARIQGTYLNPTILLVHNHYQQWGGEDRVFEMERQLLEAHGHRVITYTLHNDDICGIPNWRVALEALWNRRAARELAALVRDQQVQIVHFHNTFPRVSPAAYHAVRRAGAAVVQTLHNYRLICAGALLYRNGKPCEECLGRCFPLPALRYRCYRGSLFATGTVVLMQMLHRMLGTWKNEVDAFIALTEGAKARFAPALLPPEKVHVVGNFLPEGPVPSPIPLKGYALFIGRLDPSKGVRTLLDAWASSPEGLPDLVIAGDGPLAQEVRSAAALDPRIRWVGFCEPDRIQELLRESSLVLVPSKCQEMFGMVVLEAWRAGRPVLAFRLGALEEIITDQENGWLIAPSDVETFTNQIVALERESDLKQLAGTNGYTQFHHVASSEIHYEKILEIYRMNHGMGLDHDFVQLG